MKKIFVLLLSFVVLFVSCNPMQDGEGTVSVSVEGYSARGIEPIPMEVESYLIEITSGSEKVSGHISGNQSMFTAKVASGNWTVDAIAYNAQGIAIGKSSSVPVKVIPGRDTHVSVSIDELAQPGEVRVHLDGEIPEGIKAQAFSAVTENGKVTETLASEIALSQKGNVLEGSVSLAPGFYIVKIIDKAGNVISMDTLRVVSNRATLLDATYTNGIFRITVSNGIVLTPSVSIAITTGYPVAGGEITAEADIRNITDPVISWYLDSKLVEGAVTPTLTLTSSAKEGEHELTCRVASGSVVWSESKIFNISAKDIKGVFWGVEETEDKDTHMKIDMGDGKMRIDFYDNGNAWLGRECSYSLTKVNETAMRLDFDLFENGWYMILPNGELNGDVEFHFNPEPDSWFNTISFAPFTEDPVWTESCIEYDSTRHIRTISNPELGTFELAGSRKNHTMVNGVCSECGYKEENASIYGINSDFSLITETVMDLDVCRYWPGSFTLADGTVVNDTDHFYFRKWYGGLYPRYVIYMPYTISEVYKEGQGVYGSDANWALKWFNEAVLNGTWGEWRKPWNDVIRSLVAGEASIKTIDKSMVTDAYRIGTKITVSGNPSSISPDKQFKTDAYVIYDLQFEDGSPVTDENRFYVSVNSSRQQILYYPASIVSAYEKADEANPQSGNPFWSYLRIYYPELSQNGGDDLAYVAEALMKHAWIEPDPADYSGGYPN